MVLEIQRVTLSICLHLADRDAVAVVVVDNAGCLSCSWGQKGAV